MSGIFERRWHVRPVSLRVSSAREVRRRGTVCREASGVGKGALGRRKNLLLRRPQVARAPFTSFVLCPLFATLMLKFDYGMTPSGRMSFEKLAFSLWTGQCENALTGTVGVLLHARGQHGTTSHPILSFCIFDRSCLPFRGVLYTARGPRRK